MKSIENGLFGLRYPCFGIESDFVGAVDRDNFYIGVFGEPRIDDVLGLVRRLQVCSFDKAVVYLCMHPDFSQTLYHLGKLVWLVAI